MEVDVAETSRSRPPGFIICIILTWTLFNGYVRMIIAIMRCSGTSSCRWVGIERGISSSLSQLRNLASSLDFLQLCSCSSPPPSFTSLLSCQGLHLVALGPLATKLAGRRARTSRPLFVARAGLPPPDHAHARLDGLSPSSPALRSLLAPNERLLPPHDDRSPSRHSPPLRIPNPAPPPRPHRPRRVLHRARSRHSSQGSAGTRARGTAGVLQVEQLLQRGSIGRPSPRDVPHERAYDD